MDENQWPLPQTPKSDVGQRVAGTALGDPIEVGGMSLECNKMVWDCSECLIEVCEFYIHSKRHEQNQTQKIPWQVQVVT